MNKKKVYKKYLLKNHKVLVNLNTATYIEWYVWGGANNPMGINLSWEIYSNCNKLHIG